MKSGKNSNPKESLSVLNAQIEETERKIMDRQHNVQVRTDTLVRDLQYEATLPTTLLLASEVGFIVGELTKPSAKKERQTAKQAHARSAADVTPLKKAMNYMSLAQNLYQTLPLVWILDTLFPEDASKTRSAAKDTKVQHPSG
ncbi:hypothetical protein [Methylobacter sp. YRD-M1]|uniref:hypothetical protein n=1 Tax=Methylobacter sp. YRD-M1 TaxID=2911520 RepID=UPI00227A5B2D|nr:hypothetical protein [Methylobacter sp. YRD-M1]WAK03915.1 hypothetical protein LZ558_09050 [Methylobacter sp. YRD-M1]